MRIRRSLAMLMAAVAVVAVVITLAIKAAAIQDYHRRAPASTKLLRPIVEYYDREIQSDLGYQRSHLRTVSFQICDLMTDFGKALESVLFVFRRPLEAREERQEDWRRARESLDDCALTLGFARDRFCEAASYRLAHAYHSRLRDYYQTLLDEHRTELPPWPRGLEVERNSYVKGIRRLVAYPPFDITEDIPADIYPHPKQSKR